MKVETEAVTKLKDEIWESLTEQWRDGLKGVAEYDGSLEDPESLFDVLGIADKIGNHLVETIFKNNEDYEIKET